MKKMRNKDDISFLAKMILFFKAVKDKLKTLKLYERFKSRQMQLASYTGRNSSEESKISYFLGLSRAVLIILLIFLITFTLILGSNVVSYDKVYYMIKDIAYVRSFSERTPDVLTYSRPLQNQSFASFKNGLSVVSDSEIKLFTSTGRATLTEGTEMTNPKICTSDGYALVYDQGRRSFALYNSFVRVYSEKLDYNISSADIADNGSFLVVTRSDVYASVVKVYNTGFDPICEYKKNDYVVSAKLSDNGRYAAVLSISVKDGESAVSLNVIDCKRNKIVSSVSLDGSMPYRCDFLEGDRIAVFLDDKVCVVNKRGEIKGEFEYPTDAERIDVRKGEFSILFSESDSGAKSFAIFDSECRMKRTGNISGNVYDMKLGEGYAYILQNGKIVRCGTTVGITDTVSVVDGTTSLVVFNNGKVAACTQSSAVYVSFN